MEDIKKVLFCKVVSPDLVNVRSTVRLQLGDEDSDNVEQEQQVDLQRNTNRMIEIIFEKKIFHRIGDQHRSSDQIEEVRRLRPARPAAIIRECFRARGAGAGVGDNIGGGELHGHRPDRDEDERHH